MGSKPAKGATVRVAPAGYLIPLLLSSFLSAFLLYVGWDNWAYGVLLVSWSALPLLAATDTVSFDGRRIRRNGLLPRAWGLITATRDRIKLSDVEMVQTSIVRTIKRGANLIYTYRTTFFGKGKAFVIHSNRGSYGQFIEAVLPSLNEDLLDRRSIEVRDHFAERSHVNGLARAARIPRGDVLEGSIRGHVRRTSAYAPRSKADPARAAVLHRVGNQLRISGSIPQAAEAFRRAAIHKPGDAQLLFDFALCLNTYAWTRKDHRIGRRALAMMRLAERRAGNDADLLSRIGESYFQIGDWRRAAALFRRAADTAGRHFKTLIGLAEVSLHEGKIAHVIHNFTAACESVQSPSLKRWTRQELQYFTHLNEDEEYMELEVGRLNLIDTLESVKRSALRISLVGFPAIGFGLVLEDPLVSDVGWAVSLIGLTVWAAMILGTKMFSDRIPYDARQR